MGLSSELISQFVQAAKTEKPKVKEETSYGTTVAYNGSIYVKLDGSDLLTPISTTADVKPNERVTVMVKDHTAIVTGNLSSPSARTDDVKELGSKITEFDIVLADKVSTEELNAEKAKITNLLADNVEIRGMLTANNAQIDDLNAANVSITGKLEATEADIDKILTEKLDAIAADLKYATIENLQATNADLNNLSATYAKFEVATTNKLNANEASIDKLQTDKLDASTANIEFAKVKDLEATDAEIDNLQADHASFKETTTETLEANEASINKLQTDKLDASTANINFAKVGDLDAINADIDNLQADHASFKEITTETLEANEASINKLQTDKLSATDADLKYANIDFTNIGEAAMRAFYANSGLIKDVVIGNGTITGEIVGVTISGDLIKGNTIVAEKLVIKGSDGLYYKLNTNGVTTESEQTDQNSLNGSVIKAKSIAATKISVTDLVAFGATIGGFKITDKAIYSGVKESVINSTAGVYLDSEGQFGVGGVDSYIEYVKGPNGGYSLHIKADSISLLSGADLNSVATAVEQTKESIKLLATKEEMNAAIEVSADEVLSTVEQSVNGKLGNYSTTTEMNSAIDQKADSITLSVDKKLENYSTTTEMNSAIEQKADSINLSVDEKLEEYSTTSEMQAAIALSADGITSTVYSAIDDISIGGRNLLYRSDFSDRTSNEKIVYDPNSRIVKCISSSSDTAANNIRLDFTDYAKSMLRNSTITISFEWALLSDLVLAASSNQFRVALAVQRDSTTGGSSQNQFFNLLPELQVTARDKWNKFRTTYTITDYDIANAFLQLQAYKFSGTVAWRNVKIEFGDKATDWTPAPEDVTSTVHSAIEDISIGGRNLLFNSKGPFTETSTGNYGCWDIGSSTYAHGILLEPDTDYTLSFDYSIDWGGFTPSIPALGIGHSGTIGGYTRDISHSVSYGSCGVFDEVTDDGMPLSGSIKCMFISPNADELATRPYFAMRPARCDTADGLAGVTFTITNFKLEKGNKATDWTPAPEDVDADIYAVTGDLRDTKDALAIATTLIQQLSDSIKTLVTDGEGVSLMKQTENGWSFSLGSVQDAIDAASDGLNNLQNSLGDTDAAVDALKKSVANLNELGSYIHIITYEGEPCIELGQEGTDFKVLVTNTRIMFKEGSSVPTYISNQTLISEKLEITEELHQSNEHGSFVWSVRPNGNYGLIWKAK